MVNCPFKYRKTSVQKQTKPRVEVVQTLPVSKQWGAGLSFILCTTTWGLTFSFGFMHVNSAGMWLRRKWNKSREIKAANETRTSDVMIRLYEVTAWLVSIITTSLQISYTCCIRYLRIQLHALSRAGARQIRTIVSLLLMAEPVHLAITLSMHFLWMAALHSKRHKDDRAETHEKGCMKDLFKPP